VRLTALLLSALLLVPSTALAQSGEVCISEDRARKCAALIEAGQAGLLDRLRECEARLNQRSGALDELRAQYRAEQEQTDRLASKVGALAEDKKRLRRRPKRWIPWVVGAAALLVGGGVGYGVGSIAAP